MIHKYRFSFVLTILFILLVSTCSFEVKSENLFSLSVQCPTQINESMTFPVTVTSNGLPVANTTILFRGQTILTNMNGSATVSSFRVSPSENNTFPLIALKEGYNDTTVFITILNVPQIFLTLPDSYIRENTSFIVLLIDDNQRVVANATVAFNNTVHQSDRNGSVFFTTPSVSKRTEMPINATGPGYLSNSIIIVIYPGLSEQNLVGFLLVIGMCLVIAVVVLIYGVERYLRHRRINKPK